MAAIWTDIEFEWDEETIIVKPTLNFINKLEQPQGSSLSLLLSRVGIGDLPLGIGSHVIGTTLREAGVPITNDEVYAKFTELGGAYGTMVGTIIAGCIPMPKDVTVGKPKASKK